MSKLRATRAQVIAAAIIVVLAVVLGGVGLYGMNARGSENGAQVLENMRLQAILNTAGSGAVDAYEFSFVAVPAQRAAGVVKKFSPRFEESEKKKEVKTVYDIVKKLADGEDSVTVAKEELNMLKTELKALFDRAECGDRYRAALCERIYKLSAVAQPEFKRGLTEAITKSLGIAELKEMAAALAKAAERKMPVMPQLAAEKTEDTNAADDGAFRI